MIELQGLTKQFSNGRGIFDLTFSVGEGEVFGYLGPNGAGKSTTIRHMMGFLSPDSGLVRINGLNCWTQTAKVQEQLGYLPGEISFLDNMNGLEFLDLMAGMRKLRDLHRRNKLIEQFELEVKTPIRKMSKGMKQKVGIVAAFMHQPQVLVLDEPTSGLDPLMQQRFLELIEEEKNRGATIFMSSHIFSEVERVCDRVGIVKDGKLITVEDVKSLRQVQRKVFTVGIGNTQDEASLMSAGLQIVGRRGGEIDIEIKGDYNEFIQVLARCNIHSLDIHQLNLEEIFMHYYGSGEAH